MHGAECLLIGIYDTFANSFARRTIVVCGPPYFSITLILFRVQNELRNGRVFVLISPQYFIILFGWPAICELILYFCAWKFAAANGIQIKFRSKNPIRTLFLRWFVNWKLNKSNVWMQRKCVLPRKTTRKCAHLMMNIVLRTVNLYGPNGVSS